MLIDSAAENPSSLCNYIDIFFYTVLFIRYILKMNIKLLFCDIINMLHYICTSFTK